MLSIVTFSGDTLAAVAIDFLKLACFPRPNSALDRGSNSESLTTCVASDESATSVVAIVSVGGSLQSDSSSLPSSDTVSPGHGVQLVSDAAPTAADHVFRGQLVHSPAPSVAEYVLAGHGLHVAVAAEVDPTGPYVPAVHGDPAHASEPAAPLNVPDAHGEHQPKLSPSSPCKPTGHSTSHESRGP